MKKTLSLLLVLCAALSLLSGCFEDGSGQQFEYDLEAPPSNLDPQLAEDESSLDVVGNIFEGLLVKKADGSIVPGVAKSYQTENGGTRYIFTLRDDATWSNGDPVTAHDFAFAFKRLFSPETRSPYANDFYIISGSRAYMSGQVGLEGLGVKALSNTSLQIDLSHADESFLDLLTTPAAFPCNEKFFNSTKGGYGLTAEALISNGPFSLTTWIKEGEKDDYLVLRQNDKYSSDSPVVAGSVVLNIVPDYEDRLKNFEKGETDCLLYTDHPKSVSEGAVSYQNTTWALVLNQKEPLLSNGNIRRGLVLATDKNAIKDMLPAYQTLAGALVPPDIQMGQQSFRAFAGENLMPTPNAQAAKETYRAGADSFDAAYNAGTSDDDYNSLASQITVLCPDDEASLSYLQNLLQLWQRDLGLFPKVETMSLEDIQSKVYLEDYDIALVPITATQNSAESFLADFYTGSERNLPALSDPVVDSLLQRMEDSTSASERADLCRQAEQAILATNCIIPLYYQPQFFVQGKSVQNIEYNPYFGYIKFKEAIKN
ncbi:Stage 0 sporulation protein KA [Anaerotruncus sp. 2789STDY5834896]|uniref:Stage 0 sporulation protein KA n=1 Tax=uncultured Anaerotruncus sp. TaxID=905011 RepID=A0A1C6IK84_9FIRM|nr:Stage 0 sporulation protein KA [uncultured Anaerotruncus sp.]